MGGNRIPGRRDARRRLEDPPGAGELALSAAKGVLPAEPKPSSQACGLMWHVYICDRKGQLYTGVTTDLNHRLRQHGAKLLYSESHPDKHAAARREREIKGWRREKKLNLTRGCR